MKLISTVLKILFPITILLACVVAIFLSRSLRLQNTDQIKFISQSEKLSSIKEIVNLPPFKNKVIVVDIWSVTCSPCLQQLKTATSFKKRLSTNDVVFLYISYNNKFRVDRQLKWKETIENNKLTGYHLEADADLYTNIWSEINKEKDAGQGIPRYLIVDKNGTIINFNASGLSKPDDFYQEILQVLNNTGSLSMK
ncbi:TlpA family protein disulfide reductase [Solitalea canadensis]|uniref:TlpA family protein disulfide reductase n=1 Tax=Solitalea canadensis TaxID=995 RepID=UPI000FA6E8F2|nr:thioredoxin-like domain-containing protein [Solitalea canadensis]